VPAWAQLVAAGAILGALTAPGREAQSGRVGK
jgi:hypothetical protein